MQPTVQRLAADGYPVRQVNIDQNSQLAAQYRVTGVPCFVMLQSGREVDRVVGATSYDRLVRMFKAAGVTAPQGQADHVRGQTPDRPGGLLRGIRQNLGTGRRERTGNDTSTFSPSPWEEPPAAQPAAHADSPENRLDPRQLALFATVRLKVEDPQGHSYGTGTIIDVHGDEALVLTCGHIFRDSNGKGSITVELCHPDASAPLVGHLIRYEAQQRDVGLVCICPNIGVQPVQVAPTDYRVTPGDPVFSIGCDHGGPPNLVSSTISAVNKYRGPPNFEVAGQPVSGRSGGGLFTNDGLLIGVCNAADPQDNEGIYAALGTVQSQLAEIGLQTIYDRADVPSALSQTDPPDIAAGPEPPRMPDRMPASSPGKLDTTFQNTAAPLTAPGAIAALATTPNAALATTPNAAQIIFIARSANGNTGHNEVMVLDQPSPELIDRLRSEYQRRSSHSEPATAHSHASFELPAEPSGSDKARAREAEIVRGQLSY
jgi:hypothetical protein